MGWKPRGEVKEIRKSKLPLLILGFCFLVFVSCEKEASFFSNDKVIARVGSTEITTRDLKRYYRTIMPAPHEVTGPDTPIPEALKRALLERLIEDKLLLKEAAREGITVKDEEVDQLYKAVSEDYGGKLETFLKKMHLTPKEWKANLRKDLLIDKVVSQHMKGIGEITREEIKRYYHTHLDEFQIPMQYRLSQIVVPTLALAEQIQKKLKNGEEFSELAKRYSIFPEGKQGGDLGYWREDRLPREFEAVRQMKVGEVSDILRSSYGYHIIMLTGIREARVLGLKEAGPEIARRLLQEKRETEKERWLKTLKEKVEITRYWEVLKNVSLNESGRNG